MYLYGEHDDNHVEATIDNFGPLPDLDIDEDNREPDQHIRAIVRNELDADR